MFKSFQLKEVNFNVGGLSATVEYTSEELSFLQKDQVNIQQ